MIAPASNPSRSSARGAVSVIIPAWRENVALGTILPLFLGDEVVKEVIVSFAEGDPEAVRAAADLGAVCVTSGEPNRGRQLDLGAERAGGEWLLFQHADTQLTAEHLRSLAALTSDAGIVGGAFYRKFDERHPRLRWLEAVERWHNRSFGAFYGDQSIFVRRDVFTELGGFRNLPLMEDVDFSLRLRRRGGIRLLDPPLASSPRKHLAQGPWRTTLANAAFLILYRCGVSPRWLHAKYYRRGASGGCRMQPSPVCGIPLNDTFSSKASHDRSAGPFIDSQSKHALSRCP